MDRVEAVMKEEDTNSEAESVESNNSSPRYKRSQFLTGRGVTLRMLMEDGIVEPGEGVLSIDYLGQKFNADLLDDGRIRWTEENMIFNSPSSWAIHIKKLVNPHKRSGCGWSSVKYKGQKLDLVKSRWFCKLNLNKMGYKNGNCSDESGSDGSEDEERERPNAPSSDFIKEKKRKFDEMETNIEDEEKENRTSNGLCNSHSGTLTNGCFPIRKVVQYSKLGQRSQDINPTTLVECKSFKSLGKMQPFTISITSNCLLVIDFHSHLTTSEVVGYLGGKWDSTSQHMSIVASFPCKCRLGDKERAKKVEEEIQKSMTSRGLHLVGWYHSHPCTPAHPTLQDIDSQMDYQVHMKGEGNTYQPCLAMICTPYNLSKSVKESSTRAFWVMPAPDDPEKNYGMPMNMSYNCQQEIFLTQDILVELKSLVEFYKKGTDFVHFAESWHKEESFLEKLKVSLSKNFPKDQTDDRLPDFINSLLA